MKPEVRVKCCENLSCFLSSFPSFDFSKRKKESALMRFWKLTLGDVTKDTDALQIHRASPSQVSDLPLRIPCSFGRGSNKASVLARSLENQDGRLQTEG